MSCVIALQAALQRYDWGSTEGIPHLLGFEPDGGPYAEAWWGAHPVAPSTTERGNLDAVIAADPASMLGEGCAAHHGRLPYLLKVLAIAHPLSIQVHPTSERAAEGFAAEHGTGLALDDPRRTYKDAFHKPEMLVALTELTVLSGFRTPEQIAPDLRAIGGEDAQELAHALAQGGIRAYVDAALGGGGADAVARLAAHRGEESASLRIAREALALYPDDPGALVALAMNAVVLAPGESLYTPSGVVHCYVGGLGVEIMANSDNVVRAGFTHKPVNAALLRELALLEPTEPARPRMELAGAARVLSTNADEFELTVIQDGPGSAPGGPRIVVALEGSARVTTSRASRELAQGESVFIPASEGEARLEVTGFAVVASVPGSSH